MLDFPTLFQNSMPNNCILNLNVIVFDATIDTTEGGFSFLVLVACGKIG
jgi:hypothetical protein